MKGVFSPYCAEVRNEWSFPSVPHLVLWRKHAKLHYCKTIPLKFYSNL